MLAQSHRFNRGSVIVHFRESVRTEAEAKRVVDSAWLQISSFTSLTAPISAFVSVPDGSECVTIERLNENSAIEFADLVVFGVSTE